MTAPATYKSRPHTIQAIQYTGTPESVAAITQWLTTAGYNPHTTEYGTFMVIELIDVRSFVIDRDGWLILNPFGEYRAATNRDFTVTYCAAPVPE